MGIIRMQTQVQSYQAALLSMELTGDLSLLLEKPATGGLRYATDRLQKGWFLKQGERTLAEEGTGFGLPLARYGYRNVFPGEAKVVSRESDEVVVDYVLDLAERLGAKGKASITNELFYRARESLCTLHRRLPPLRNSLSSLFDRARSFLHLETRFEQILPAGTVRVTTKICHQPVRLVMTVDLERLARRGCTGIVIANEQGATYFDSYQDSNGVALRGDGIGTWQETRAAEASFVDSGHQLIFTLSRKKGARLFRGRELKPGRLAWAGLSYVLPPQSQQFQYEIRLNSNESTPGLPLL